jgi:hypothetical protein
MNRALVIFAACLILLAPTPATARPQHAATPHDESGVIDSAPRTIDGVAVRIEDDIIMESEVRELGKFQELVDEKIKPREELLHELEDQWIIRGEAKASKFGPPSAEDVDKAYASLSSQFGSAERFREQLQFVGLTEKDVRRLLSDQLYFARFLDYRFRPAAQVDDSQVAAYYRNEFVPAMKAKGQSPPPLEEVQDRIHEVLVQQAITDRADKWLDETRAQLRIEIPSEDKGS